MNALSSSARSNQGGTNASRPVAVPMLMLGAGLLVHAAMVVAELVDLPIWVAVVECLCASMVGLRQLRRMTAALDQAATAPRTEDVAPPGALRSVASPWVGSLGAFPAPVVIDERSEPAARR